MNYEKFSWTQPAKLCHRRQAMWMSSCVETKCGSPWVGCHKYSWTTKKYPQSRAHFSGSRSGLVQALHPRGSITCSHFGSRLYLNVSIVKHPAAATLQPAGHVVWRRCPWRHQEVQCQGGSWGDQDRLEWWRDSIPILHTFQRKNKEKDLSHCNPLLCLIPRMYLQSELSDSYIFFLPILHGEALLDDSKSDNSDFWCWTLDFLMVKSAKSVFIG